MRTIFFLSLIFATKFSHGQNVVPLNNIQPATINSYHLQGDSSHKKWFISTATGVSSSINFFKGGHATVLSLPLILQLNHRLNNNWYAFAAVSAAPSYINFSNSFITTRPGKGLQQNTLMKNGTLGIYSRADLGLMYVNEAKTFSISGSIGIERNSYSGLSFYPLNNSNAGVHSLYR